MTTDEHRLTGRTVWVIGASSGIGAALATELVDRGARVAISARREDQLDLVAVIFNAGFWQRMNATAWDRDVFAALMKIARFVPVRLWAAAMSRTTNSPKGAR